MAKNKKITIVLKPGEGDHLKPALNTLVKWLGSYPAEIQYLSHEAERLPQLLDTNFKLVSIEECYAHSDLIISLGGDGTLIGTSRIKAARIPPIFGINMGRLGFITEFTQDNYHDQLQSFFKGGHTQQSLPLFKLAIFDNEKECYTANFINDAVIGRCDISRMVFLNVKTHEEKIFNLEGDGLIISSPVGSTAYSLSAGGPILHPDVPALLLTAICPHTLSSRPVVIPSNLALTINTNEVDHEMRITLDGQEVIELQPNQTIVINQCLGRSISLVKNPGRTYFKTLREKFTHGGRGY